LEPRTLSNNRPIGKKLIPHLWYQAMRVISVKKRWCVELNNVLHFKEGKRQDDWQRTVLQRTAWVVEIRQSSPNVSSGPLDKKLTKL
jgi:hypothetical protein